MDGLDLSIMRSSILLDHSFSLFSTFNTYPSTIQLTRDFAHVH